MSPTVAIIGAAVLVKAAVIAALVRRHHRRSDDSMRQRQQIAHLARVAIVGQLSGGLAHELNQPLTSILSNAQAAQQALAREQLDVAELRDILEDIVTEDKRAGALIARFRTLLKNEEPTLQRVQIPALLQDVQSLVRSNLTAQSVQLRLNIFGPLPDVLGDGVQLQQVLLNLLLNACEAVSSNAPADRRIELGAGLEPDGRVVRLSVRDQGPGIAADSLERVFDAFFTTKSGGLGLGLAICRQIVSAHGGRLWATSNGGRGAVFHLTLPTFER